MYTHTYAVACKQFYPKCLQALDIIIPIRFSNFGAVNPFNIDSLLACGNYSASFSI